MTAASATYIRARRRIPAPTATFELVDSRVLSNGIILATYRP